MLVKFEVNPNPNLLTSEIIQNLGKKYLEKYGEEPEASCFCFFSHQSHPTAKKFRAFNKEVTVRERWNFLVSRYRELPNNSGEIATTIRELFRTAFYLKIKAGKIHGLHGDYKRSIDDKYSTSQVADIMQNCLDHYFVQALAIENTALLSRFSK